MGRYVPEPDSEFNFWSNLTDGEVHALESLLPPDIRP